jgi:hypothetical protein
LPSIINASSSGSGGIVQTADASGVLQLQSNGTVAINILSGTSIAVGSATAYNGGGFAANMSIYGTLGAAITLVNSTEQFQVGANSANNLGFYNPTHSTYMAAMNQYGIGVGDAIPSSGFGVTFPSTQSPSSNSNTLDDYEEGTWTPSLLSDGNAASNYSSQVGYYRKIGSQVTLWLYVQAGTIPSGSYVRMAGLPFSVNMSGTGYQVLDYTSGSGKLPIFLETYIGTSGQAFQIAAGYANPSSFAGVGIGGVYTYVAS